MTTVYSKLNNPSDLTSGGDSQTFVIKNADVDLTDKIKVAINKLKNINQKPRKQELLNFHVLFVIKTVTSTKRPFFVHIVTSGFIGNVMLHPNRNIQDYQMSQMMPPFNVCSVI